MKRVFRIFTLVLILSLSVAAAGTVKLPPIGTAEQIISQAGVYCNEWQDLIGDAFGYNMSFDEENVSVVQKEHYDVGGNKVRTVDFDGIQLDVDDDLTAYAAQIPISTDRKEKYTGTARVFALVSALAYDYPSSEAEMSARYMTLLTEYNDFMEKNAADLAGGSFVYWDISTEKGDFEFQFCMEKGRILMLYDKLYFAD